jgi:hypothetical protein
MHYLSLFGNEWFATLTLLLPTVTLGFRPFGLGLACAYYSEDSDPWDSGPKSSI